MSRMEEKSSNPPMFDRIPPKWVVEVADRHSSDYHGAWDRGWMFIGNYASNGSDGAPLPPTKEVECNACPRLIAHGDGDTDGHGRDRISPASNVLCTLYQIRTGTRIRAAYIGQCQNKACQAFHYGIRVEQD